MQYSSTQQASSNAGSGFKPKGTPSTPVGKPGAYLKPSEAVSKVAAFGRVHRAWHRALNVHQMWGK